MHSSESRAQSQHPQSPQPIRGYTGELDLLVGGAKLQIWTRPTSSSSCNTACYACQLWTYSVCIV